ncbi:DUF3850 domain-containing protein [Methylobacterium terricola]|uniref:DUF3850 domain-containing protein n=1 Tax=Methylobacterium terricola TaxID=2583531 RepID=A0A5C4LN53_9HYPH|nr:DUF3850 domain-containing protein [Methylobacterium terricola]TNC14869.1 DUF3850 domain-containing protein [Methylobacterium terricola]
MIDLISRQAALEAIQKLRHAAACNFSPDHSGALGIARTDSFYAAYQAVKELPTDTAGMAQDAPPSLIEGEKIDHEFKSHPDVFWPVARGEKTFEFRKDDRGGYHVGQTVRLRCYDPARGYLPAPALDRRITNILKPGEFGLQDGYCILSLAPIAVGEALSPPTQTEIQVAREAAEALFYLTPHAATADAASVMLNAGKMRQASAAIFKHIRDLHTPSRQEEGSRTEGRRPDGHGLTLRALHAANIARQAEWCPDQVPDLSFRGNELGGECGEAQNVIKKLERERQGWRGSRATLDDLAQELADVVICADLCAITAGIDLDAAVVAKFNATSEKQGLATMLPRPEAASPVAEGQAPGGWQSLETAPMDTEVEVRTGFMTFRAKLVPEAGMTENEHVCDQWQATREGEHPPCWSEGACWSSNVDHCPSMQPEAWRPLSLSLPPRRRAGARMRDLDDFLFIAGIAGAVLILASLDNSLIFWVGVAQLSIGAVGLMILRAWQDYRRRIALAREENDR